MKKTIEHILAGLAALILLQTLYFKFSAAPESVALFTKLGMEPFGRISIGVMELIAGILLIIPTTRSYGGFLGLGLMSGALFFHLTIIGIISDNDGGLLFFLAISEWFLCLLLAIPFIKTIIQRFKLIRS